MTRRPHPVVSVCAATITGVFVAVPVLIAAGIGAAALAAVTVTAACLIVDR